MKGTIGFIGLGGMGLAMATNVLKAGFGLRVYNRTAEKARPLLEQGATLARSPTEAAEPGGGADSSGIAFSPESRSRRRFTIS
jgi:pyrroline-5-carboxylate reductase